MSKDSSKNTLIKNNRFEVLNEPRENKINERCNTPKYNTPKYNAPKYNTPKYNAPKYNTPKYNTPKYNAPKYNAPFTDDIEAFPSLSGKDNKKMIQTIETNCLIHM